MSADPDFLSVEDVTQIHDEQIAAYGGAAGVRDQGLLESAVAMPRASFGEAYLHEDLAHMAAAYGFHIAQKRRSGVRDVLNYVRPLVNRFLRAALL